VGNLGQWLPVHVGKQISDPSICYAWIYQIVQILQYVIRGWQNVSQVWVGDRTEWELKVSEEEHRRNRVRINMGVQVTLKFFDQGYLFQDFRILSRQIWPELQDSQNKMRNTITYMIYMTPEGKYVPVTHTQQRLTEFLARTEISWETFQLEIQRSGAPGWLSWLRSWLFISVNKSRSWVQGPEIEPRNRPHAQQGARLALSLSLSLCPCPLSKINKILKRRNTKKLS